MSYKQKHPYIKQIGHITKYKAKETAEKIRYMFHVKDCHSICVFCEFYEQCKIETSDKDGGEQK